MVLFLPDASTNTVVGWEEGTGQSYVVVIYQNETTMDHGQLACGRLLVGQVSVLANGIGPIASFSPMETLLGTGFGQWPLRNPTMDGFRCAWVDRLALQGALETRLGASLEMFLRCGLRWSTTVAASADAGVVLEDSRTHFVAALGHSTADND